VRTWSHSSPNPCPRLRIGVRSIAAVGRRAAEYERSHGPPDRVLAVAGFAPEGVLANFSLPLREREILPAPETRFFPAWGNDRASIDMSTDRFLGGRI
jgi:hypothetical protein